MRRLLGWLFIVLAVPAISCELSDGKRCGEGYTYDAGYCMEIDTDTDSDTDTGAGDSGVDSGVTGIGEVCTDNEDCEGYDADYCAMMPGATEGQCAVSNCLANPNDCPEDLLCCDFPPDGLTAGIPNLCIPPDEYETYSNLGMCDG